MKPGKREFSIFFVGAAANGLICLAFVYAMTDDVSKVPWNRTAQDSVANFITDLI